MARPEARDHSRDRSVGVLLAITPSGDWTVRARGPEVPGEGAEIEDRSGRWRGRVSRVFGPVGRPYLSVRPRRSASPADGARLVGSEMLRAKGG